MRRCGSDGFASAPFSRRRSGAAGFSDAIVPASALASRRGLRESQRGEARPLARVDHESEVLESFVTMRRDNKSALEFLRKSLRRHGLVETIVTGRLASYGAALKPWAPSTSAKSTAGRTTGWRIPASRCDDANGRCCDLVRCEVFRDSPPCMDPFTTTSTRNVRSSSPDFQGSTHRRADCMAPDPRGLIRAGAGAFRDVSGLSDSTIRQQSKPSWSRSRWPRVRA